jgi:hypothetical protein
MTFEGVIEMNKELNAREWAKKHGMSYRQTLRLLKNPETRKTSFKKAYQRQEGGSWFIIDDEEPFDFKPSSISALIAEEERKAGILKHQQDLRDLIIRWQSQLWLPPPWKWDIANLDFVLYTGINHANNGYKLAKELLAGEISQGHIRNFGLDEGRVSWGILEGGNVELKVPVEEEPLFKSLELHTSDSQIWSLFGKWKKDGGTFLQMCSSLLARIQQDAQRSIGARSELNWWSIYHDAFYIRSNVYRCGRCGSVNNSAYVCPACNKQYSQSLEIQQHIETAHPASDPKAFPLPFCAGCNSALGWLQPLLKGYGTSNDDERTITISIPGWTNIEESVEAERFTGITRAHASLIEKYRGCDIVETILELETKVKLEQSYLSQALTELSKQKVFPGTCASCPNLVV